MRKLAALVVVGLALYYVFLSGDDRKFECVQAAAFGLGVAGAQDEERACTIEIEQAAVDRQWASATWDQLKASKRIVTTAWYYYADGERREVQSGVSGSDAALEAMLDAGIDEPTAARLKTHVEMKIAAEMIEKDEPDVVIVINHPGGMCAPVDRDGCYDVMPRLLSAENRLAVWWKDRDGVLQRRPFAGTR
ncbi:DddA-like double-stranded DNA deaminase toxin [Saccharothrix sp.]|uniref:DddA-like double-stranded DNA deaminase toxin n=1 Tax=Saccharothrix sp. TaxID=1873460 RepID=UPI002811093A|nr:DddA-like double-stranded DNA deaminase toxin [Saccharothrix sp.]